MRVFSETEYTVRCARCGRTDSIRNTDGDYRWNDTPSRYFHREGWRTGEGGENVCLYCVHSAKEARSEERFK